MFANFDDTSNGGGDVFPGNMLPSPTTIVYRDDLLWWSDVVNAVGYSITTVQGESNVVVTTTNSLVLHGMRQGEPFFVRVAAIDAGGRSSQKSATFSFIFENNRMLSQDASFLQIPMPKIIGNVLEWPVINGAAAYSILDNNVEVAQVILPRFDVRQLVGEHRIRIRALSTQSDAMHSNWSSEIHVFGNNNNIQLDRPIPAIFENIVSWPAIVRATSYQVKVEDSNTPYSSAVEIRARNGNSASGWSVTLNTEQDIV